MPSCFYECRKCCKVFTLVRKPEECEQPATCPACGKSTSKRVIIGPFFLRKSDASRTNVAAASSRSKPTSGGGPWNAQMINCEATNCDTGIKISGPARIQAHGLKLRRNRISIDIGEDGELHDFETEIKAAPLRGAAGRR